MSFHERLARLSRRAGRRIRGAGVIAACAPGLARAAGQAVEVAAGETDLADEAARVGGESERKPEVTGHGSVVSHIK